MTSLQQSPTSGQQLPPEAVIDGAIKQHADKGAKARPQRGNPAAASLKTTIWRAMGESPADILSSINISNKALSWVGELSKTIANEASSDKPSMARIKLLADMASYLSDDYEELGLAVAENLHAAMVESGVIATEVQRGGVTA